MQWQVVLPIFYLHAKQYCYILALGFISHRSVTGLSLNSQPTSLPPLSPVSPPRPQNYTILNAGFLYPSGDYATAARLTQRLVAEPALRASVGAAARKEVEEWGWTASTERLRTLQYRTAINSYKRKHM